MIILREQAKKKTVGRVWGVDYPPKNLYNIYLKSSGDTLHALHHFILYQVAKTLPSSLSSCLLLTLKLPPPHSQVASSSPSSCQDFASQLLNATYWDTQMQAQRCHSPTHATHATQTTHELMLLMLLNVHPPPIHHLQYTHTHYIYIYIYIHIYTPCFAGWRLWWESPFPGRSSEKSVP